MKPCTQNAPISRANNPKSDFIQLLTQKAQCDRLPNAPKRSTMSPIAFNQAIEVSQPCTSWQTAASFAIRAKAAIFTSVFPLFYLFNGRQGQGGITPDGTACHYCEPCLLSAPLTFRSVKAALLDQAEKVKTS